MDLQTFTNLQEFFGFGYVLIIEKLSDEFGPERILEVYD